MPHIYNNEVLYFLMKKVKLNNFLDKDNKNKSEVQSLKIGNILWILKITLLAFSSSLLLSILSETLLSKSDVFIAILLLIIFMALNVFSDMFGLAITSCQIDSLEKLQKNEKLYNRCLSFIKNADKVSSILCDVIGDISGILCGVSGTMISISIATKSSINSMEIIFSVLISSTIAGLTVLFKAIAKNYAVNNSSKLVVFSAKIFENFSKIIGKFKKKKQN